MTAIATKHHYIPQFYQRGFIADGSGLIWVYEKDREPRQLSVRKTGMEINLYGFTNRDKELDTQAVESELAKIDSDGADAIHKIEAGVLLDEAERWKLCRFVSVMWRRTLKHKQQAESMITETVRTFFEEHDEDWVWLRIRERVSPDTEAKRLFEEQKVEFQKLRTQYLNQAPDFLFPHNTLRESVFEKVLYVMDWAYFKATSDTEFLTCDDPVAFSRGSGLKDREAVIMFPLSRKLFLQAMWISEYHNNFQQLRDVDVRTLNRYIVQNAHKQVYVSKKSKVLAEFISKRIGEFEAATNRS